MRPTPAPSHPWGPSELDVVPLEGGAEPRRLRCCLRGAWLSLAPGPAVRLVCCSSVPRALPWFQGPRCCPREGGQSGAWNRATGEEVQAPPTILCPHRCPCPLGWAGEIPEQGQEGEAGALPRSLGHSAFPVASSCPSTPLGCRGKLSPWGKARPSPQFWETVLGEGLRQSRVPFELEVHQVSKPGQGQRGQLVGCQVPRTVDGQVIGSCGTSGGRAERRVWPAHPGRSQRRAAKDRESQSLRACSLFTKSRGLSHGLSQ